MDSSFDVRAVRARRRTGNIARPAGALREEELAMIERELDYTDADVALLREMSIAPDKPVYRPKWRGFFWGMTISTLLWTAGIYAVIWAYRWFR